MCTAGTMKGGVCNAQTIGVEGNMQAMSMGNSQTIGVGNNSQFADNGSSIAFYLELIRDGVVIHVNHPSQPR